MESMAYNPKQFEKLALRLTRLADKKRTPKAILLSGGGNDFTGESLEMLLNHSGSTLKSLNEDIVHGAIKVRTRQAYIDLIRNLVEICTELFGDPIPILLHGYAHPVPDGRGFAGGFWFLPGPWLEPAFRKKGYRDLPTNTGTIRELVDVFNDMIASVVKSLADQQIENVRYVDVRKCLTNGQNYKDDWSNEIHPTDAGFSRIAEAFRDAIEQSGPNGSSG